MSEIVDILLKTAFLDTDLLGKNDGLGDNFSVFRNVDFVFYASTEEKAEIVASFINDNAYANARYEASNDRYRILAVVNMPITQNIICSVSGLMACIGKIFSVEYDGWGSEIKKI